MIPAGIHAFNPGPMTGSGNWTWLIGDVIEAGDTSLVAVHTPGHAPDHLCFWHEETRILFCGDLAQQGVPAAR